MLIIKNGIVHNGKGQCENTDIGIEDGKITVIKKNLVRKQAKIVDAAGCVVLPGFVDALNVWGTVGPGWTEADNHEASEPITPEMNILYGFDHDGMNFQKVYTYGVTAACISPATGNLIGGQSAVFKTFGLNPHKMLVKESNAMISSITNSVKKAYKKREVAPMTRMGIFSMLLDAFEKATRYREGKDDYNAKSIALKKVLSGEQPLFVNCSGKAQIHAVLSALKKYPHMRIVLTGAFGLDDGIEEINNGNIPVLLGDQTECYLPDNAKTEPQCIVNMMENPNSKACIAIACCGDGTTSGKESLLWNALYWRRRGLSSEKALTAITYTPARILGIDDKVGSIEVGKDADLSIWTDHPLDTYQAKLLKVLINGEDILEHKGGTSCW